MTREDRQRRGPHAYRHADRAMSPFMLRKLAAEAGTVDVPDGSALCGECFRVVRLHRDGTLYGHHADWGVMCTGGSPRESHGRSGKPYAGPRGTCAACGRQFALRADGTLNTHTVPDAVGSPRCAGSGQAPA